MSATIPETLTAEEIDCLLSATDSELEEFLRGMELAQAEAILAQLIDHQSPEEKPQESLSLHEFGVAAWGVLRPGEAFIDGEHIRVLCAHLEHATNTPGYDLAVMMPPACGKSIWTTIIWPAWVWGPRGWAAARFLYTSYSLDRGKDDAEKCKNLIESEWYSSKWDVELTTDAIMSFSNTAGGQRKTSSTGGLGTGEHPHFVVADDANKQTDSADEFSKAIKWWTGQMSTRGIVASIGSRHIVIGQRLQMADVPQACVDLGYDVVCMPMWAWDLPNDLEVQRGDWRPKPTQLPELIAKAYGLKGVVGSDGTVPPLYVGWTDWRQPGDLLWPDGIPEESARKTEAILGPVQAAAQLQQRPIRVIVDGMFPREKIAGRMLDWENVPWAEIDRIIRYWDKAGGTSVQADYTAGVLMARWIKKSTIPGVKPEIRLIVLNVIRGRWNPFERNVVIRQTAEADLKIHGHKMELWIEEEARGGAGIESRDISKRELLDLGVRFDAPTTKKILRARPFSSAWHGGLVWIVAAAWNVFYLDELSTFDGEEAAGTHDDCVDGSSGASNKLLNSGTTGGAAPVGGRSKVGR